MNSGQNYGLEKNLGFTPIALQICIPEGESVESDSIYFYLKIRYKQSNCNIYKQL